jgi:hypothetical protein
MFNWLKSRDRQIADKVLALLAHAIKEVHPNRFIDPSEAGMVAQSKLSQLNLLLGKGDTKFTDEPCATRFASAPSNCWATSTPKVNQRYGRHRELDDEAVCLALHHIAS